MITNENILPVFKFCLRDDLKNNKEFLPKLSEPDATGYDVRSAETNDIVLSGNGKLIKIPLGFRALCPVGWWFELHPRSSMFVKRNVITHIGIIDQNFPGEVCLCIRYFNNEGIDFNGMIKFGDMIGQIIPVKLQRMSVEEVSDQEYSHEMSLRNFKRTGGFGSTGER